MLEEFYKLGALQALEDAGLIEKDAGGKTQLLETAFASGARKVPNKLAPLYNQSKIDPSFMKNFAMRDTSALGGPAASQRTLQLHNKLEGLGKEYTDTMYNKQLLRRLRRMGTLPPAEQGNLTEHILENQKQYGIFNH